MINDNIYHNKIWNFSTKRIIVLVDIDTIRILMKILSSKERG